MAQHRFRPACQDGRHPPALATQAIVSDRENPAMNAVKTSCLEPPGKALAMNPDALQLLSGNDTVLACGDPRNHGVPVGGGDFLTHARE